MPHSAKRSGILLKLESASCQLCCTDENAYLYRYTELSVVITRFILPLVGLTRKWKTRTFVAYALSLQTTSLNKNIYACTVYDMTTTASVAKTRRSLRRLYMRIYSCCMQRQSICRIPPNIRILLKLESASCELCCTDENAYLYRYTELSVGTTRFILSLVGLTRK